MTAIVPADAPCRRSRTAKWSGLPEVIGIPRDILAPIGAHLSLSQNIASTGPVAAFESLVQLDLDAIECVESAFHALATKAADYTKKQHVFRVQTSDWAQYLFQTR